MEMDMEEYLKNMRSLRCQMNDIEEEAAKRSVEEQKQMTAIDVMEKDLELVKSETKQLNEEAKEMVRARGQLCCQIVEKQQKIAVLETESSTLSQTLELLQQEKLVLAAKFEENRNYYTKVLEDLEAKLHDQKEWFSSNNHKMSENIQLVEESPVQQMDYTEGNANNRTLPPEAKLDNMGDDTSDSYKDIVFQMEHAKAELEELRAKKSEIELAINESKQLIQQFWNKINTVPLEVKELDMKALEDEHNALLADKAGEAEYLKSLEDQISQLKAISHVVKCPCGEEYKVDLIDD
ncbi:hypothetical protein J5N97_008062 [Dioscorea zingiberensis]|uniref:Uncharacterized protein n=1 Tax=Dioscorea zingiberensis TaxID=325984 RepID=A0A9D5DD58_9LILI|nr:hypothetical protein J5N97_008062 [Dioscorea zingiberensis]